MWTHSLNGGNENKLTFILSKQTYLHEGRSVGNFAQGNPGHHPYVRKRRGTKEPLDERERGE